MYHINRILNESLSQYHYRNGLHEKPEWVQEEKNEQNINQSACKFE